MNYIGPLSCIGATSTLKFCQGVAFVCVLPCTPHTESKVEPMSCGKLKSVANVIITYPFCKVLALRLIFGHFLGHHADSAAKD